MQETREEEGGETERERERSFYFGRFLFHVSFSSEWDAGNGKRKIKGEGGGGRVTNRRSKISSPGENRARDTNAVT